MNQNIISTYRSEVIERTINIEWLMIAIISQHYFGYGHSRFIFEVLYDEYFSFALKRRILEKIIENSDRKMLQNINRINTIRNYFAHCNQEVFLATTFSQDSPNGMIIDPRRTEKPIDFETMYIEFCAISPKVEVYLATIYEEKGGKFLTENDAENIARKIDG